MKKQILTFLSILFVANYIFAQTPVLLGATTMGGAFGVGNIFVWTPQQEGTLYNFGSASPDGFNPCGSLINVHDSLLCGMTYAGGANNEGTVFSYNIVTGGETDVHDFGSDTDGTNPYGSPVQVGDTFLYGLTFKGGIYDGGIIFSYNIFTGAEKRLHDFGNGGDGAYPTGALLWTGDSLLYGMTQYGGYDNSGVLFSYNIYTGVETALYDFGYYTNDGQNPAGSLIQATNGLLYGMTPYGGDSSSGTLFSYNTATQTETNLYNFGASDTDAANPYGSPVEANDSVLYGMTYAGGVNSYGAIFSYNLALNKEATVYDFGNTANDGEFPEGSLIQASDGLLYGLTNMGGVNDYGAVVSYDISSGAERLLHSFAVADGAYPTGDLLEVDSVSTGVKQLSVISEQLSVYPNPSSDFIYVSFAQKQTEPVQLSLYNILGQEVYNTLTLSHSNPNSTITIPVTTLPDGVYVLKVNCSGSSQQKEIVVAR